MLTLNIRGATVTIPEAEIERLWLAGVREGPTTSIRFPRIGSLWNGGVYAGIVRGGEGDYHLIASNDEIVRAIWGGAKTWASNLTPYDGRSWRLPTRRDQSILYGNVPELFAKEWYWSGEKYAPDAAYAWAQLFDDGYQTTYHPNRKFHARAVRRVPIR